MRISDWSSDVCSSDLRRSGIRPVSLLVDITQYVMLELGQPMHAFDRDLLHGPVGVRLAREGQALTLLDGREEVVDPGFAVITDNDRAVALARVTGDIDTRGDETTQNVFLESLQQASWGRERGQRKFRLRVQPK